jgi:hypothetical protein
MQIDIYVKKTNKTYKTIYGVPFQCVELIRRFFSTITDGASFPNVVDAVDFYQNIHSFDNIDLRTFSYPYQKNPLKPGAILFWKRRKPDFPFGHCALVLESNENETVTIQQNLNPPIRRYNTKELFAKMNRPDSKFLGIKTFSRRLPKITCNIVQI